MNKSWHEANPMPKNASRDQRIRWHAEHAQTCACREVPPSIREDVKRYAASDDKGRA